MKILIGEDDKGILDVITIILEGEGCQVVSATEEKGILSIASKEQPSMIFLDLALSGSDGGTIARKLKADPVTKRIPLIMMSANMDTEKIAHESGADDFLLKPFDIETLLQKVKTYTVSS